MWQGMNRLGIAIALLTVCAPSVARAQSDAVTTWAAAHAIVLRSMEPGGDDSDLAPLRGLIGPARIIAIGEPMHGAHEPLSFRNRIIQYLIEHEHVTAVGLESGFSESRLVDRYIAGGPGDAASVARDGITWGFGIFKDNVVLVEWLRAWNAIPTHVRKVRFYGFDLGGGEKGNFPHPRQGVDSVLAYLARVDSAAAREAHTSLDQYLGRFSAQAYDSLSSDDRIALGTGLARLATAVRRAQRKLIATSSEDEYAFMLHRVTDAQQMYRYFDPPPATVSGARRDGNRQVQARDSSQAENVKWALEREGTQGRLVIFAHNGHVMSSTTNLPADSTIRQAPRAMGAFLRAALGRDLVIIGGTSGGLAPAANDSAEVDRVLANVGVPRFLLDLRAADGDALRWLSEPHTSRSNNGVKLITLRSAFDIVYYADKLTSGRP